MKTNIKRVQMPATLINILYFMMLLIGALGLFAIHEADASPMVKYCERQYDLIEHTPRAVQKCSLVWEKLTYQWITGNYK